jgi:MoxR-like ATPase
MRKGAVLLIDEIDLASNKIMCLQSILEGSGYLNKKTGEYISPAKGFTIIATANTKGKGSDDGRFIGTNILNEAFLERFSITMEQEYPSNAIEKKILFKEFERLGIPGMEDYINCLVTWADVIRKSFFEGAIDELISTRRLVHIAQAFSMFTNKMKAIELCVSRFDTETKATFLDLYTKIDAEPIEEESIPDITDEELPDIEDFDDFDKPDTDEEAF